MSLAFFGLELPDVAAAVLFGLLVVLVVVVTADVVLGLLDRRELRARTRANLRRGLDTAAADELRAARRLRGSSATAHPRDLAPHDARRIAL